MYFVSHLTACLTAKDLGYFFEDKLGEGMVMDSRFVTDRLSRVDKLTLELLADLFYSTSIGYVEFRTIDLVEKALTLW